MNKKFKFIKFFINLINLNSINKEKTQDYISQEISKAIDLADRRKFLKSRRIFRRIESYFRNKIKEDEKYKKPLARILSNLGITYQREEKLEKAIEYFEETKTLDSRYFPALINLPTLYLQLFQRKRQIEDFRKSEQLFKETIKNMSKSDKEHIVIMYANFAILYASKGDIGNMKKIFDKIQRIDSESIFYLLTRASYYIEIIEKKDRKKISKKIKDAFKKAEEDFKKVLSIDERNKPANLGLGILYMKKRDYTSAIKFLETAEDFGHRGYGMYARLGIAHSRISKYKEARKNLKRSLSINRKQENIKEELDLIDLKEGNMFSRYIYIPWINRNIRSIFIWGILLPVIFFSSYQFYVFCNKNLLDIILFELILILIGFVLIGIQLKILLKGERFNNLEEDYRLEKEKGFLKIILKYFIFSIFIFYLSTLINFNSIILINILGSIYIIILYTFLNYIRKYFLNIIEDVVNIPPPYDSSNEFDTDEA